MLIKPILSGELFRYGVSGVITTAVNILTYYLLLITGMECSFANTVAIVSSIICAYIISKKYVFQAKTKTAKESVKEALRFIAARGAAGIIEYIGLIFFIEICRMNEVSAKTVIVTLVVILNYVWSKKFVFKRER